MTSATTMGGAVVGETGRAKVNLTLQVRGRRADGYHELVSLVTFADIGDRVTIEPEREPGHDAPDRLSVDGPFAHAIAGENLLSKALALLQAADPCLRMGSVHLAKSLPVAAGLGGGSADAAALLRAVRRANPERAASVSWMEIAARLGSDVPVCLGDRPALVWGRGELMAPVASLPQAPAVLVNPRIALATGAVFEALRAGPASPTADVPAPPALTDLSALLAYVGTRGNDLEPAAKGLLPEITEIETLLAAQDGCRLAAMSGSGPTCFGIFASEMSARCAAAAIAVARPKWWVAPTRLAGAERGVSCAPATPPL